MRKTMLLTVIVFSAFSLFFDAEAGHVQVNNIEIYDYGIYGGSKVVKMKQPGAPTGMKNMVKKSFLVNETTDIPATLGTRFGIRFVVNGSPFGDIVNITKVVILPKEGLKVPNEGNRIFKYERKMKAKIGASEFTGYTFDNAWETIPGKWTIQLWYDGKKMAEKGFTVQKTQ
jgi:hypothetical protein